MNKEISIPADESYAPSVKLRAGGISAIFEEGRLRYLYAGDTEIIRMVYPALRDENWSTITSIRSDEKISLQQESFSISYSALYESGAIRYKAFYKIEGHPDHSISFSMRGEALSSFLKRRIGLCVLHPIETFSGRDIEVMQPDGIHYLSDFPSFVSPFQPFLDVQHMKWTTANSTAVEITYEGAIFETEDQRNWSDNSYKTYSTPLSFPAPAMVKMGDVVEQKITIRADTKNTKLKKPTEEKRIKLPFPSIGYGRAKDHQKFTAVQMELLKKIPFNHYSILLELSNDWKSTLEEAADEARSLSVTLELAIRFESTNKEAIHAVIEALRPLGKLVSSVLILLAGKETAPKDFFEQCYTLLKTAFNKLPIGYGTNDHFADLNRNRPTEIPYDFVNFHIQPQVHTTDNRSIMENLSSHESLVASINKITSDKPVHVSPVTFCGQGNDDKRFRTHFAGWWTLLALRNLSAASSLTFYEVTGNMGLINDSGVTPVYQLLETIQSFLPMYIYQHTGNKVILENSAGDQLVFTSKTNPPDAAAIN